MRKFCDGRLQPSCIPATKSKSDNSGFLKLRYKRKKASKETKFLELNKLKDNGLGMGIPQRNIDAIQNLVRKRNTLLKQHLWNDQHEVKYVSHYRTPHDNKLRQVRKNKVYINKQNPVLFKSLCFITP